jgi:hypothetical protein
LRDSRFLDWLRIVVWASLAGRPIPNRSCCADDEGRGFDAPFDPKLSPGVHHRVRAVAVGSMPAFSTMSLRRQSDAPREGGQRDRKLIAEHYLWRLDNLSSLFWNH